MGKRVWFTRDGNGSTKPTLSCSDLDDLQHAVTPWAPMFKHPRPNPGTLRVHANV